MMAAKKLIDALVIEHTIQVIGITAKEQYNNNIITDIQM